MSLRDLGVVRPGLILQLVFRSCSKTLPKSKAYGSMVSDVPEVSQCDLRLRGQTGSPRTSLSRLLGEGTERMLPGDSIIEGVVQDLPLTNDSRSPSWAVSDCFKLPRPRRDS
eukprot:Hpha_TRINITY_DN8139_c0_g1::TRINITY_DN8139_c0_g1_i1::g.172145::m.172145